MKTAYWVIGNYFKSDMSDHHLSETISAYLWHSYVPPTDSPAWIPEVCSVPSEPLDYSLNGAVARLDALFNRVTVEATPPYVVPLSGGWDSRLILAALRERTDKIVAVTFGCPGQLDFELGHLVAEAAQVEHIAVRLDLIPLEWSTLKGAAQSAPWTYIPDAFFLSTAYQKAALKAGKGATAWSGFLGDPLTGGHYHHEKGMETTTEATGHFANSQRRVDPWYLSSLTKTPYYHTAPSDWVAPCGQLEWLDLSVRQRGCIAPIVLGRAWRGWRAHQGSGWGGLRMVAPFADREWAAYWLHAPRHLHQGQLLYQQMAEARFPALFALPSKYTWGVAKTRRTLQYLLKVQHGVRNRIHRRIPSLPIRSQSADNYIDFQRAFRKRDDYISVMEHAIALLKLHEATPWLDLEGIWKEHYCARRDHSQALQVLLGLAVNLEARGFKSIDVKYADLTA